MERERLVEEMTVLHDRPQHRAECGLMAHQQAESTEIGELA
jgi:hypothetical protein